MPFLCPTCKVATFDDEKKMMSHFLAFTCTPRYTDAQLQEAFAKVKNRRHWKGRIDRVCEIKDDAEMELIEDAIVHFTGSVASFDAAPGERKFRVRADGYWAAIGS